MRRSAGSFTLTLLLLLTLAPGATAQGLSPSYAEGFRVEVEGDRRLLEILQPWPGGEPLRYLLCDGESADPLPPAGVDGVISVPVRSIVSLSSTYIVHLEALGLLDRLVAVDRRSSIYSSAVRELISEASVMEVGSAEGLDVERLVVAEPGLVMTSALGAEDATLSRLERASLPALVNGDWLESSPLGRAEWIKLFGVLFDREREAAKRFDEIVGRYESIRGRLAEAGERPQVLLNAPYQGSWALPAGESYMARLLEDAGARYPWGDTSGTGSLFLDLEEVFARAGGSDYWVNLGFGWRTLEDVVSADPRLASFDPYSTGRMYHYNRRVREDGANDFWESGAARPDLILADLGGIFHPQLMGDHELHYYRRLE